MLQDRSFVHRCTQVWTGPADNHRNPQDFSSLEGISGLFIIHNVIFGENILIPRFCSSLPLRMPSSLIIHMDELVIPSQKSGDLYRIRQKLVEKVLFDKRTRQGDSPRRDSRIGTRTQAGSSAKMLKSPHFPLCSYVVALLFFGDKLSMNIHLK